MKIEVPYEQAAQLSKDADELKESITTANDEVMALVDLERLIPTMESLVRTFKLIAALAGVPVRSAIPITKTMSELDYPKDNGTTALLRHVARQIGKAPSLAEQLYVGELIQFSAGFLESQRQVGVRSVSKMQEFLRSIGYDFGMTLNPQQQQLLNSVNGWIREND